MRGKIPLYALLNNRLIGTVRGHIVNLTSGCRVRPLSDAEALESRGVVGLDQRGGAPLCGTRK
jgi:hypothetical protein